jgi:hypothetical protein
MKSGFNLWMLKPKGIQRTGCTHIQQTRQKKFKKMSAYNGGIQAIRDHKNIRSVLQNTKKNSVGPFRTKDVECWYPV